MFVALGTGIVFNIEAYLRTAFFTLIVQQIIILDTIYTTSVITRIAS